MEQKPETFTNKQRSGGVHLLPLTIGALICFVIGVTGGGAAWYFFGTNSPLRNSNRIAEGNQANNQTVSGNQTTASLTDKNNNQSSTQNGSSSQNLSTSNSTLPEAEKVLAPAGEIAVKGAEVVLGGGNTNLPVQRKLVNSFAIAETEVTVSQFREFLEATKETSDLAKKVKLTGKDDEPVTGISWEEAKAYCNWLGQKIKAEVRLPTEAEWELAARGESGFKYPWGNEWRAEAAASLETKGTVQAVKSRSLNKSPFGAYDMAGNVWEWTAEEGERYNNKNSPYHKDLTYVIKGGSAEDERKNISAQARDFAPKSFRAPIIGFRYVVIRNKQS